MPLLYIIFSLDLTCRSLMFECKEIVLSPSAIMILTLSAEKIRNQIQANGEKILTLCSAISFDIAD